MNIIVFPEYGLGIAFERDTVYPFLEDIPDPVQVSWNPCLESSNESSIPAQYHLSCIARKNAMYVVANMGDVKHCVHEDDPNCPKDGRYQFNTNVVFNPEGKLIACYHKETLYDEDQFDMPNQVEHVTFQTPFGKFGTFICFDMLFKGPAVDLVEDYDVQNIAFSTAWRSLLPLMKGVVFHESWAIKNGVNLLSSQIHVPKVGFSGSGIYAATMGALAYYVNMTLGSSAKLLISDVPIIPSSPKVGQISLPAVQPNHLVTFTSFLQHDLYTFTLLDTKSGNLTLESKYTKCNLVYNMKALLDDELYAMGVFDGLHLSTHNSYIQVCTLVKCGSKNSNVSCGQPVTDSATVFTNISLTGAFHTAYVYPQVAFSGGVPDKSKWMVTYDSSPGLTKAKLDFKSDNDKSALVLALYGRKSDSDNFRNDHNVAPSASVQTVMAPSISTLRSVVLIFLTFAIPISGFIAIKHWYFM